MNSRTRFVPLIILGAIILSLIAVLPALSATGKIRFYDSADPSKDQKWARAGGLVNLEVTDADLDVPVKYVILRNELDLAVGAGSNVHTGILTDAVVTLTAKAGSDTVEVEIREIGQSDPTNTIVHGLVASVNLDKGDTIALGSSSTTVRDGDTVGFGSTTIREVVKVATTSPATTTGLTAGQTDVMATVTLTLNAGLDQGPGADGTYDTDGVIWKVRSTAHEKINVDDCPTCAVAPAIPYTVDGPRTDVTNAPVVDSGVGNRTLNFHEVRFSGSKDSKVTRFDAEIIVNDQGSTSTNTVITVDNNEERVTATTDPGDTAYLVYWGSAIDHSKDVDVRSSADTDGVSVVLTETGKGTGAFRGVVKLVDDADTSADGMTTYQGDTSPPMLKVNPAGTVTLRYKDGDGRITKTIDVESTPPVLSNFSPAHNSASEDDRPEVTADVTDSDSGIKDTQIFVVFALLDDNNKVDDETTGDASHIAISVSAEDAGRVRNITSGFRIEQRMPDELETGQTESTIAWWVVAIDEAGNKAVSDQNTDSDNVCVPDDFPVDGASVDADALRALGDVTDDNFGSLCQPFIVMHDEKDPVLEKAVVGAFWDTDSAEDDKTSDLSVDSSASSQTTSVMLVFDEAVDSSTVSADDFKVGGSAPLAANHYAAAPSRVFLDVPAQDPDARPDVELVGLVADIAGNTAAAKKLTATDNNSIDGIGPTLEVTLAGSTTGARPVTKKEITITVTTNENTANPTVTIKRVGSTDKDGKGNVVDPAASVTPKVKSPRTYEGTWSAGTAGLYNVYVTAADSSGNVGKLGKDGASAIDLSSGTSALLFEVDNSGPTFTLDPASADDPNAFVRVDFSAEGKENTVYAMGPGGVGYITADPDDAATATTTDKTKGKMDDLDSYGMVTLVSATLAGSDISADLERLGDNSFLLVAPNLAIGKHKIEIEAEDSAGNSNKSSVDLEVTERKPFSLTIRAGVSLISFPGDPMDPDINAVFPSDHPVQEVITYDPTQPGKWFASKRDDTSGLLDGNLTMISGGQAYLVRSNSTKAVNVIIDRPSSHDLITPPQIDLVAGWNLVPVTDITFKLKAGDTISYVNYFGDNKSITRVYGVDTVQNRLILVQSAGNLKVGDGYWVFASDATSIAPGVTPQ